MAFSLSFVAELERGISLIGCRLEKHEGEGSKGGKHQTFRDQGAWGYQGLGRKGIIRELTPNKSGRRELTPEHVRDQRAGIPIIPLPH